MSDTQFGIEKPMPHYYGDVVRRIFVGIGLVMGITFPFFYTLINLPVFLSILAIVILVFLAGWENPRHTFIIVLNTLVSIIGCTVFEYATVRFYVEVGRADVPFFWLNQVLATAFFVAIYYSSKTLRGLVMRKK